MQELSSAYTLEEKPTIPMTWKTLHLVFYFLACIFGILASVFFHSILSKLDDNCFLATSLHFKPNSLDIDLLSTNWRPKELCEFYLYSQLLPSILSVIWMVFFVMCARGGLGTDGYISQPWRIVTPSLIFNVIAFGVTLNASINFHTGVSKFCTFDLPSNKLPADTRLCRNLLLVSLEQRPLDIHFVHDITNCLTTQWLSTLFWFASCCWSIARCVMAPDFTLVKISVMAVSPDEEDDAIARYANEEVVDIIEPSPSTSQETISSDKKTT